MKNDYIKFMPIELNGPITAKLMKKVVNPAVLVKPGKSYVMSFVRLAMTRKIKAVV